VYRPKEKENNKSIKDLREIGVSLDDCYCYIVTSVYRLFFMHTLIIIIHVDSPSIVWHVIIVISIVIIVASFFSIAFAFSCCVYNYSPT
jgi:hypothetical protein